MIERITHICRRETRMHRLTRLAATAAAVGLATVAIAGAGLLEAGQTAIAANDQVSYPSPSPVTTTTTTTTTTPATPSATTPAATSTPATATATATPATPAPTTPAPSAQATIKLASAGALGTILTDGSSGMTLYTFGADTPGAGTSACYTACAQNWPPFLSSAVPAQVSGLSGTLGLITRTDGTQQVTLGGRPLYLFKFDTAPGDVKGQGINAFGGIWLVATASGATPSSTQPASTPAAPSTGSGTAPSHSSALPEIALAAAVVLLVSAAAALGVVRRHG